MTLSIRAWLFVIPLSLLLGIRLKGVKSAMKYYYYFCVAAALSLLPARADDWPQWLGPQRDGVWREKGILEKFPSEGPTVRWRVPIGAGYSGPAVAAGKVYVTDRLAAPKSAKPASGFDKRFIAGSERVL